MSLIRDYQTWLRGLVESRPFSPLYNDLFVAAFAMKFQYYIDNDVNRAIDGIALRSRYRDETSIILPELGECTVLEFLVALAIRMNTAVYDYEDWDRVDHYFWEMMDNLGLDAVVNRPEETFEIVVERSYDSDGYGGLFPLRNPGTDARELEIWAQMNLYLDETHWE